ncbi:DUF6048 family protein [Flavobacteriaceae bacterium MHTCC 0001]
MKPKRILNYFISIGILVSVFTIHVEAQNDSIAKTNTDSTVVQLKYGLRVGIDTGKLIRSYIDDEYTGIEFIADYRLTKDLYIAGEVGNEEKLTTTDFLDVKTKGTYFKVGVDYNLYQNWLNMDNMVYFGFRGAASSFSHIINEYTIYNTNQYWQQNSITEPFDKNSLSAIWSELILGIKAELFNNLYLGLNAQLKVLLTETVPDNFENIYIPGFNKTYDSTRIGVGYGYTISYRIPIYKKKKVIAPEK